jgi:hypothetical protein
MSEDEPLTPEPSGGTYNATQQEASPRQPSKTCPDCKGTGIRHVCGMVCVDVPCDCTPPSHGGEIG